MYSAILWLNGSSHETLIQSLAAFGKHAGLSPSPEGAVAPIQDTRDIEAEARAALRWLVLSRNRRWLMIVNNADREYSQDDENPLTYENTVLSAARWSRIRLDYISSSFSCQDRNIELKSNDWMSSRLLSLSVIRQACRTALEVRGSRIAGCGRMHDRLKRDQVWFNW